MIYSETILDDFINKSSQKPYGNIAESLLKTGPHSLLKQEGWNESEYLYLNIQTCVRAYSRDKDAAINMFKDFVAFLEMRGIEIKKKVAFPPIPISNSFERLMFIAKYMQRDDANREELEKLLWVSPTTIDKDISRLLYEDNPDSIQVLGRPFLLSKARASNGTIKFESTAHPLFLAPNLTQVIILLEGLKDKANNKLFATEARATAAEIWNQLSDYAKDRVRFVLKEILMNKDLEWYESLEQYDNHRNSFHVEKKTPRDIGFIFDCIKNHRKGFCIEYDDRGKSVIYKDCIGKSIREGKDILVHSGGEDHLLHIDDIKRIAYSVEELLSEDSIVR